MTRTPLAPVHGGNLAWASAHYGVPLPHWLDLSTGINPWPYPLPAIPAAVLHRLPYPCRQFQAAAEQYYQTDQLLAVPGSQWAIAQIPASFPPGSVAVPAAGYLEHAYHWQRQGHRVIRYDPANLAGELSRLLAPDLRAVVVINPNNPTADVYSPDVLRDLARQLARREVCLVVDEAFVDADPRVSLVPGGLPDNLLVLRSFGKFFGLPGLRLGFVMASAARLAQLGERLGPWAVNGAAQHAAQLAFADSTWQMQMRERLSRASQDWHGWLAGGLDGRLNTALHEPLDEPDHRVQASGYTALFASFLMAREQAERVFELCAQQGVLVRVWPLDEARAYLRFGLADRVQAHNRLGPVFDDRPCGNNR